MTKGTFIKRDSRTGKFIVGREGISKLNAMEGIRQSPSSKAMFADFDKRNVPHDQRREAIVAKHRKRD
ncbi:hypothetical protein [Mesorhizobium sp. WSM2239]|uniref:Uncharacterized protein n=2 Tax=unclassified Mesorhizobium TaxID=325217 RepID=A0AAU8D8L7_9HYPH